MLRTLTALALTALALTSAACGGALAQAQQPPQQQPQPAQQQPAQAQPLSSSSPQRTTASYEDWTVRCETRGTVKSCEMVQAVTAPGQQNPVTQVAMGRASSKEPMKMVFQLPVNVWIPAGLKFAYDTKVAGLAATFKWCAPAGCFAELDLNNDLIKRMRGLTVQGRFEFKDAAQRDVAIPVSFKGFGQAYDALIKE